MSRAWFYEGQSLRTELPLLISIDLPVAQEEKQADNIVLFEVRKIVAQKRAKDFSFVFRRFVARLTRAFRTRISRFRCCNGSRTPGRTDFSNSLAGNSFVEPCFLA